MKEDKQQIDSEKWVTQLALADSLGISVQRVHNWIKRGKIDYLTLPGSRIKLVDRTSIKMLVK